MNVKTLLLRFIKNIPISNLKVVLLRFLFNYSIGKNVKIGRSIINCKTVIIGNNVSIAHNNVFSCNTIIIGEDTKIHSGNIFQGNGVFSIGRNSRIINNHFFDLAHDITIGNNTWIAGRSSQFWTHGSTRTKSADKNLSIVIGDNNYLSSNCLFSPGVEIMHVCLVGLGSVVTKSFDASNIIISGNRAQIIKGDFDWRINW